MMLFLTALLLVQVTTPPANVPEDDVVVTARKIQDLDIHLKRRRGVLVCRYKQSSGDAALDASACEVAIACYQKAKGISVLKTCIISGMTALITSRADPT